MFSRDTSKQASVMSAAAGLLLSALAMAPSFLTNKNLLEEPLLAAILCLPLISSLISVLIFRAVCIEPGKKKLAQARAGAEKTVQISSLSPKLSEQNSLDAELENIKILLMSLIEQGRETRQREKSLLENAVDVICVIDTRACILQVNSAAKAVLGYSPDELLGKDLSSYLIEENQENSIENILRAEKSIARITFENKFRKSSGEIVDLLWSAHWSARDGGLFCVVHDITERKQAEQLLKESEERIAVILENLSAGVLVVNNLGIVEFVNRKGEELLARDQESINGRKISDLLYFSQKAFSTKQWNELILSGQNTIETQLLKGSGEHRQAELTLSRFQLAGENCYLLIFFDVTARHAIEMAKREFVSMVSHDLRTPLNSILSILSYLESGYGGELKEQAKSFVSRGKKEVNRLIALIQDLLDLEKMKAGEFTMHPEETEIEEIVKASIEATQRFAEIQSVKIVSSSAAGLHAFCDGARIIQVLVNLLDNAIKFSPAQEAVLVDSKEEEDQILISVSNKGREIPPEKLSSIFLKFEQVEESDATEKKGTGLGLAICKTIVEQHSGKIWAVSSKEAGSCFTFSLPKAAKKSIESI